MYTLVKMAGICAMIPGCPILMQKTELSSIIVGFLVILIIVIIGYLAKFDTFAVWLTAIGVGVLAGAITYKYDAVFWTMAAVTGTLPAYYAEQTVKNMTQPLMS